MKGPQRSSQRPTSPRPQRTKERRRQRATDPHFQPGTGRPPGRKGTSPSTTNGYAGGRVRDLRPAARHRRRLRPCRTALLPRAGRGAGVRGRLGHRAGRWERTEPRPERDARARRRIHPAGAPGLRRLREHPGQSAASRQDGRHPRPGQRWSPRRRGWGPAAGSGRSARSGWTERRSSGASPRVCASCRPRGRRSGSTSTAGSGRPRASPWSPSPGRSPIRRSGWAAAIRTPCAGPCASVTGSSGPARR